MPALTRQERIRQDMHYIFGVKSAMTVGEFAAYAGVTPKTAAGWIKEYNLQQCGSQTKKAYLMMDLAKMMADREKQNLNYAG